MARQCKAVPALRGGADPPPRQRQLPRSASVPQGDN